MWQNILKSRNEVNLSSERVTSSIPVGYRFDVQSITKHLSLVSLIKKMVIEPSILFLIFKLLKAN